jgi:hypothetical protein
MMRVLPFATLSFRARYGILLMLAPALLVAGVWWNPHLLLVLVLLRQKTEMRDLSKLTTMSTAIVALGFLITNFVFRYGPLRFESSHAASASCGSTWTWRGFLLWTMLTLALPIAACVFTTQNSLESQIDVGHFASRIGGIAGGAAFGVLIVLALTIAIELLFGHIDSVTSTGMMPFERSARLLSSSIANSPPVRWIRGVSTWAIGTPGARLNRISLRGYRDETTKLLFPGQAQLLLIAIVGFLAYVAKFVFDLYDTTWSSLEWPIAVYALILVYIVLWILAGLAYFLDYYAVPPLLLGLVFMAIIYWAARYDNLVDLTSPQASADKAWFVPAEDPNDPPSVDSDNLFVAAYARSQDRRKKADFVEPEQLYLADVLKGWKFPKGVDEKRTLVVVTSSGGGIQAAAWTAEVLTKLDEHYHGFSQSIAVISSVSGGSVGAMYYLGHRGMRDPEETELKPMMAKSNRDAIRESATDNCTEACAWGLAFPDLFLPIVPNRPRFVDRGLALESVWWNRMGQGMRDRRAMSRVSMRDLAPLVMKGQSPAIIFNATCVETGQRALISPIHAKVVNPIYFDKGDARYKAQARLESGDDLVSRPVDFLEFYDQALKKDVADIRHSDLRVSTAVRLSASFSYVTPVARPYRDDSDWRTEKEVAEAKAGANPRAGADGDEIAKRVQDDSLKARSFLHYCDGGYADNAGLLTAVRLVEDLVQYWKSGNAPQNFDRVLILRIEPFPATRAGQAKANQGFESAFFGPQTALAATRVSTQAERGELEIKLLQEATLSRSSRETSAQDNFLTWSKYHLRQVAAEALPADLRKDFDEKLAQVPSNVKSLNLGGAGAVGSEAVGAIQSMLPQKYQEKYQKSIDQVRNELSSLESKAKGDPNPVKERDAKKEESNAPIDGGSPIQVYSVTLRFDRNDTAKPGSKDAQADPPLSWTLSQLDIDAIHRAWKDRYEIYHRNAVSTSDSPGGLDQLEKFFKYVP